MRQNRSSLMLIWALSVCIAAQSLASAQAVYYAGKGEGWFWKEVIPDPAAPDLSQKPLESSPELKEVPPTVSQAEEHRPLSPAWLREKLPEYRDRAIENPSPDNVRAFYYLQRYAMDLAERFAQEAQRVVVADPGLDENARRPISSYGGRVFDQVARDEMIRVARQIASKAGVWYFFRSDCPYCRAENPVLARLQQRIGLTILPISIDGRAMSESEFEKFVPDRGHAQQLGVTATPTLYLVRQPGQFVLLSEGLLTDDELIERMVLTAHQVGWITDDEFNSTLPRKPASSLMEATNSAPQLDNPVQLVEWLRAYQSKLGSGS